ncbi:hypothetical protein FHT40_001825 [Mycolicibacterium sp. BK556]|uniref:DUF4383 domain-containing protein n=1 Tax=Mycobacteriaceae TaxID=1762 RepID=UPI00180C689B|nr:MULTISPECIES: DUF4383 domain-containing protein [Mycobacteriaceae]MBB3602192.1 hypothetical protein [Mycolicibacterium sp. BK556]MBB3631944.1 hypothetical protein [Mycolicibacterium sp. BK607]MBB3749963.1 hypothetical protein [Mycolicibacterium sp. BK634]
METTHIGWLQRPRVGLLAVQVAALLVAAAFVLIAIAGFIPGLTVRGELFGVFRMSVLHNVAHLVFGVAGLLLARTFACARAYLIGGGLIYLGLWVYGLLADPSALPNILPLNNADNWLHLSIGVVMTVLGLTLAGSRVPTGADGEPLIDPEE